jgi:hypothetical protein
MPHLNTIKCQASTINMLPSNGKPDFSAAAKLMVPVILEALHDIDNEKKVRAGENSRATGIPSSPHGVK